MISFSWRHILYSVSYTLITFVQHVKWRRNTQLGLSASLRALESRSASACPLCLRLINGDGPQTSSASLSTHTGLISSPATDRDHVFLAHTKQVIYMTRDLFTLLRGRGEGGGGGETTTHRKQNKRGKKTKQKEKLLLWWSEKKAL